jgi:hypothetical protein
MPVSRSRNTPRLGRAHAVAIDSDGWMDLLWEGQWDHPEGPEAVDANDIRRTHDNLVATARAEAADWPGIPVYVGHPEENGTLVEAPAQAWIKQFRIHPVTGRLQGQPEWVGPARAELVESRLYKFLSAYEWGDIAPESGVFHPAYIGSVGLTNNPVKRAGQHPLANAQEESAMPAAPAVTEPPPPATEAAPEPNPPTPEPAAPGALAERLGQRIADLLSGAPDRETALAAIQVEIHHLHERLGQLHSLLDLVDRMAGTLGVELPPDLPLPDRCAVVAEAVGNLRADVDEQTVDQAVRDGAVPDTEEDRANALRLLRGDRQAARSHFASSSARATTHGPRTTDPLAAHPPRRANAVAASAPDVAAANRIRARANTLLSQCGGNWDLAWNRARRECAAEVVHG